MTLALARILQSVERRSRLGSAQSVIEAWSDDAGIDRTVCLGDWKDAIQSELHTMKASLEEIAQACDENEMWGEGAKLRAIAKDL